MGKNVGRPPLHQGCGGPKKKPGEGLFLGDVVVHRLGLPGEDDIVDVLGEATGGVGVPQRNGRQILEQDLLGLDVLLVGLVVGVGGQGFVESLVKVRVRVVAIVGGAAGPVERSKEVALARVVGLPAGAESGLNSCLLYTSDAADE